jgi:hypothetical protein
MLATLETMCPKAKEWIQAAVDKAAFGGVLSTALVLRSILLTAQQLSARK